ncbi:MAG: hypothetical protein WCT12_24185 [Verrucomicrobiota bacterium]
MILLDTHAWIWWASQSPKLSAAARQAIENETKTGVAVITVVTKDERIQQSGLVRTIW